MDNAARGLGGEQVEQPMGMGMGMGMGGTPDLGPELGGGEMSDLDAGGDFGAVDAAAGGGEELGRERRGMAESRIRNRRRVRN